MSSFSIRVRRIAEGAVENHPNADRLSVVRIDGFRCVEARRSDGSPRYATGDLVVYVPEGAVVPENLLRMGFWNEAEGKGFLAGSNGDRVHAVRLRGVVSQGILLPVERVEGALGVRTFDGFVDLGRDGDLEGTDVAERLGIRKHVPEIPAELDGAVVDLFGIIAKFDFESLQAMPDLFEPGERVVATEKIHGVFCQIGHVPGLSNPQCFAGGDVYVASKWLGNKGLAYCDVPENDKVHHVRVLRPLIAAGLADRMKAVGDGLAVRLFGEIYGRGVQDLHYGAMKPTLRVHGLKIGDRLVPIREAIAIVGERLALPATPVLYDGPFDLAALEAVRDGRDAISGTNLREGVVVVSADETENPMHGRKIAKLVSPDYLLRKGNRTEYQ